VRRAGSSRFRLGRGLAAAQIAVSFILLLAAGLFIGTLRNLLNADLGFRTGGVLLVAADAQHAVKERRSAGGIQGDPRPPAKTARRHFGLQLVSHADRRGMLERVDPSDGYGVRAAARRLAVHEPGFARVFSRRWARRL